MRQDGGDNSGLSAVVGCISYDMKRGNEIGCEHQFSGNITLVDRSTDGES